MQIRGEACSVINYFIIIINRASVRSPVPVRSGPERLLIRVSVQKAVPVRSVRRTGPEAFSEILDRTGPERETLDRTGPDGPAEALVCTKGLLSDTG